MKRTEISKESERLCISTVYNNVRKERIMSNVNFSHTSVLLFECIEALNIRDGLTYVDCTAGGGGHSLEIAK